MFNWIPGALSNTSFSNYLVGLILMPFEMKKLAMILILAFDLTTFFSF